MKPINYMFHIISYFVIGYMNAFFALNVVNPLKGQPPLPDILFNILPQTTARFSNLILLASCTYFLIRMYKSNAIPDLINLIACVNILFFVRVLTFTFTILPPPMLNCYSASYTDPINWNGLYYMFHQYDDTCVDIMFSGHAVYLSLMCLYLLKFSECFWEKNIAKLIYAIGIVSIVSSRIHYTSDVIIGIALTKLVFDQYMKVSDFHITLKDIDKKSYTT